MYDFILALAPHLSRDIVVEALPVPLCQDGEIRVAVDACAVCGTDLKSYLYGNPRIKVHDSQSAARSLAGLVLSILDERRKVAELEDLVARVAALERRQS